MSDAAATDRVGHAPRNGLPVNGLSAEAIEKILSDFRDWLTDHGAEPTASDSAPFDLLALVGQFTALRHEVNLQTKASRSLAEQATKLLEREETSDDTPMPLVKVLLDIADVLAVSKVQMQKLRETAEPLLENLAGEPLPEAPATGFLGRMLGKDSTWTAAVRAKDEERREVSADAAATLLELATAAADGYAMSLRRIERAFPELGLEPIDCVGQPFDPEVMEVVEIGGHGPAGTVTDELRRGYRCNGRVVRYAQVRVAR